MKTRTNYSGTITDDTPEPAAFSVDDFCARYGIGRQLAYDEINAGRLLARKIRRRTVIARVDADAWLAAATRYAPRRAQHHGDKTTAKLP